MMFAVSRSSTPDKSICLSPLFLTYAGWKVQWIILVSPLEETISNTLVSTVPLPRVWQTINQYNPLPTLHT